MGPSTNRSRRLPIALGAVLVIALAVALLDPEIGARRWWSLDRDLGRATARIEALREDIRELEKEREALRDDEFAIERAIREDLGLARPGEILVRDEPPSRTLADAH